MKYRAVWKVILFGFITLGIYDLYWLYATRKELVAKGHKVPRVILLMLPYLLITVGTIILTVVSVVLSIPPSDGTPQEVADKQALTFLAFFGLTILGMLIILPVILYWFYQYSRAMSNVIGGQMNFGLWYALALLFGALGFFPVWPGIVQEEFNKLSNQNPKRAAPPAADSAKKS